MKVDSELFIHDSDKAALDALKAIPGFNQLVKAFMSVWSEKEQKIINMSSNLKLGNGQMDKYYNLLPPICEKLGIEVPELYITLDVVPNSWTYGDTHPYIVITSGLLETLPDELIPTVLAHECGHIACHHTLYTTMGSLVLNGAANFLSGIGTLAIYPIQMAFAYWMRCSEFSADRAAAICDGNPDKMVETCMRLAGYDKDILADANVELFLNQAKDYKELVNGNVFNKSLEFLLFNSIDHPLNAVRAFDIREWSNTERYRNIQDYLSNPDDPNNKLPIKLNPSNVIGKDTEKAVSYLQSDGFTNITSERETSTNLKVKPDTVTSLEVNGKQISETDWFKFDSTIRIRYYEPKTDEEIKLEHPGEINLINGTKPFVDISLNDSIDKLKNLGFINIVEKEMAIPKISFGIKPGNVAKVMINQQTSITKAMWFKPDAEVTVYYYVQI